MRFGTKVAALLGGIALLPILTSIVLVEQAITTGERFSREYEQLLEDALGSAKQAYRDLFDARKAQFQAQAIAIAATWNGHIDDPAARYIRHWEVLPEGSPNGDASGAFPEDEWRSYVREVPLGEGKTLRIEFVAAKARFEEYQAIGELTESPLVKRVAQAPGHKFYHWVFVGMFAALMLPMLALGLVVGRRITRRLAALAGAAREVGAGNLGVRVPVAGRDEIAELGGAFNEMVAELDESRARIAYLERIGAWQEVARRLAHEIKNPLTPIQLAVQQLHNKYPGSDPKFQRLLDEVNEIVGEEIGTLRRLVEDFSAFAKLPRVVLGPLDLGELVADVVRGRPEWEGKVRAGALDEPFLVRADKQLLRRALVNLVENALQAGARTVEVRAERAREPRTARLIVDDDGPGVPTNVRERLFEPYFTTKEHGTGLGLAIVKKIALEHGGDVSCESSPSRGARFVLELPLG
ncbi:MAG TPA: ATP-binding protein [Polyangia bacterium]|nr:ATP-binding protein [Polyangia bacterium]